MVIQELFKPKKNIIATVTNIEKRDNNFEGIKQNCYAIDLLDDEGEHFKEKIPCLPEITNSFINEIKRILPEIRDLQDEEDIINTLKGKRFEWVKRQFGSELLELPPVYYYFPQKVKSSDEQQKEFLFDKYLKLLPEIIEKNEKIYKLEKESFTMGYKEGLKKGLEIEQ